MTRKCSSTSICSECVTRPATTTYLHNGQHPAWKSRKEWQPGEVMSWRDIVWPLVRSGGVVRCGTCGDEFGRDQLREPFIVKVGST